MAVWSLNSPQRVKYYPGKGLRENIQRRSKYYISDYLDGFRGDKTIQKVLATIIFLYFAIILPCLAFGVLDSNSTHGLIDARRAIIGQAIGGLVFHFLAGQPLVIIATTAPLSLYIKVAYDIAQDFEVDFYAFYACIGLWNALFCILYAVFDLSVIMKYATRSSEEIFATFIFFAFSVDAFKDLAKDFGEHYNCLDEITAEPGYNSTLLNATNHPNVNNMTSMVVEPLSGICPRERSVLFLFLMFGTVLLAKNIDEFRYSRFLFPRIRELVADYALSISVIIFSAIGTFGFHKIDVEKFTFSESFEFVVAPLETLTGPSIGIACILGFVLSLLFFMDQNISAAMVNRPENKIKKGDGYHLDLFVVGIINAVLSLFGLPWMHGILPHSPLHAKALCESAYKEVDGHKYEEVLYIRETRITGIVAHALIAVSYLAIPIPLVYIPVPVLDGLFLFMALGTLGGNNLYERFLLWFTDKNSYPPYSWIQTVPMAVANQFTVLQIAQLIVLCFFGFYPMPYVQMAFPIVIALFIPIRYYLLTRFIRRDYVDALDPMQHLDD